MSNTDIKREYSSTIWKFIPTLWRHWWIAAAQDIYPDIDINTPSLVFIDRTNDIKVWNNSIESYKIRRLATA